MRIQDVIFHHKKEVVTVFEHEATVRIKNGCLYVNKEEAVAEVAEIVGYPVSTYGMQNPKIEPKENTDLYIAKWTSSKLQN